MAFTDFTAKFKSQEAQDATSLRLYDQSLWLGEEALCTTADLYLSYYDTMGVLQEVAPYSLILGADRTRFDEFLSDDGHKIEIESILPGQARFTDGYYLMLMIFSDGLYEVDVRPRYLEHQAFLAKLRCMSRKMPISIIDWPSYDRTKILDAHAVTLLLDNAEDAADLGKRMLFEKIVRTLNRMYDKYQVTGCF